MFDKVTIVIGATDESKSLIESVETIRSICDIADIDSILIVIPPRAEKRCIDTIDLLMEKYPHFVRKLIQRHPYIGGAMRDSINDVFSSHIMFLSADLPTSLDCVPIMIESAKSNSCSIVKISRWLKKDCFYGYNKTRKIFNRIAQTFLKILFCSSLTDFTSPVLISPTHIYKKVRFKEWGFPCLLEAVLLPLRMGCEIREISAKCLPRTEGHSKNSTLQTVLYLKTAIRIRLTPKSKLIK